MSFPFSEARLPDPMDAANRVDTVLFDYGQVLSCPPNAGAWAKMLTITGLDEVRFHAAYWEFRHDYDRAALTGPAYWHAVAARAGVTFDDTQMAELLSTDVDLWTDLNMPMVEWAGRLQRAGVRTGILSNIGDSIAEGLIAKLPWIAGFYHCVWSHALFMAKPEPAIFIKTAEALETASSNILFIDDREENIAAAAKIGMQTILFSTNEAFEREMRDRGLSSLLNVGLAGSSPAVSAGQSLNAQPEPAAK